MVISDAHALTLWTTPLKDNGALRSDVLPPWRKKDALWWSDVLPPWWQGSDDLMDGCATTRMTRLGWSEVGCSEVWSTITLVARLGWSQGRRSTTLVTALWRLEVWSSATPDLVTALQHSRIWSSDVLCPWWQHTDYETLMFCHQPYKTLLSICVYICCEFIL